MEFTDKYNHIFSEPIRLSDDQDNFLGLQLRKSKETEEVFLVITKFSKYNDQYLPEKSKNTFIRLAIENFQALVDSKTQIDTLIPLIQKHT